MDERSAQRNKIAMRKKRQQRKRKRIFILLCFILCCTGIILLVFKAPFFNITKVNCKGMSTLSEKQILEKAQIEIGQNIFGISTSAAEERVATIAYVSKVEVKRSFPNIINITVSECKPQAYVTFGKKYALIDDEGKILEIANDNKKYKVMTIKGLNPQSPKAGVYIENKKDARVENCKKTLEILKEYKLIGKVREMDFSKLAVIKINYDNRVYVNCGSYDSYESFKYKLKVCSHLIEDEISPYEEVEVDLSDDKAIVRPYESDEEKKKRLEEEKAARAENNNSEEAKDKKSESSDEEENKKEETKEESEEKEND